MTAIAMARPPTRRRVLDRLLPALRRAGLFRVALAVVALHVVDDNFLQPPPGTAAADHLVSGLVPLALLAVVAWAYPRLSGPLRGATAIVAGIAGIVAGVEAAHYTSTLGPSGDDFTGLLSLGAGVLLLGLGAVTLWTTRRLDGSRAWRYPRRVLLTVAGVVAVGFVAVPVGLAYVTTHVGRAVVPPDRLGVAHEDVRFTTSDGLTLHGWYVPSRNGAAVIAFPGRNGPQAKARMLARHGYGVLLFDRRGEGVSDGEPNSWGWDGDADVKAAIAWLQRRPDVDPRRIGGIGLSVGGEMMLETAAETPALRAVVSDGAGARTFSEERHYDSHGLDRVGGTALSAIKTAAIAVFSNQSPPADLGELVTRIGPRPLLLIAAVDSGHGEELNRRYARAAGPSATLWEVPRTAHMGAQKARPAEYERRVIGFFDAALAR